MIELQLSFYAGPGLVTVAYLLMYYIFMLMGLGTKLRLTAAYKARGERFDRYFGQDREMLAADRLQLNTLEHMPPFLVLLWMQAVFVSPAEATAFGVAYVLTRVAYPFLLGGRLGRAIRPRVFAATLTSYAVLGLMGGRCLMAFLGA